MRKSVIDFFHSNMVAFCRQAERLVEGRGCSPCPPAVLQSAESWHQGKELGLHVAQTHGVHLHSGLQSGHRYVCLLFDCRGTLWTMK